MSATSDIASAVSVPSESAPAWTEIRIGWRVVVAVNVSSRLNSSCTGRPSRSTARATTSSVSISCLPPNPPPTRPVSTRTRSAGRSNSRATASRVRNGVWVLVRRVSRPSSSSQPTVACVSRWAAWMRWMAKDWLTTAAALARPAVTSPTPPCTSTAMLRAGSAIPAAVVLSPCTSGASGAIACSGSMTAGLCRR